MTIIPTAGGKGSPGNENPAAEALSVMTGWLHMLFEPGQLIGLRAIRHHGGALSGNFDFANFSSMAKTALDMTLSSQFKGIYFTLNPLQHGRLEVCEAAEDGDVLCRRWLLIDVDPKRPGGYSATDDEKAKAKAKIVSIREYLRRLNWPDPFFADSGNGFHLLYRIDLPADDGGLVRRVLIALADRFDDEGAEVDRKVFNPSRITKLYGTQACKGTDTPDRPHRWTAILERPADLKVVAKDLLEDLAGPARYRARPHRNKINKINRPQRRYRRRRQRPKSKILRGRISPRFPARSKGKAEISTPTRLHAILSSTSTWASTPRCQFSSNGIGVANRLGPITACDGN